MKTREKIFAQIAYFKRLIAHSKTPKLARALMVASIAYLASPIDIVPDFVPVLGQLDDVLVVGILLFLALRLVPQDVKAECKTTNP